MKITTIQVTPEIRKKLQERKLEWDLRNVNEVIIKSLKLSGNSTYYGTAIATREAKKKEVKK